ncbi:MAG: flagellar motor switch protein FliG [Oligoflexales bacterium]
MGAPKYSSQDKAAILLLGLGKDLSAEILKNLPDNEIKKLLSHLQKLGAVPKETLSEVAKEFLHNFKFEPTASIRNEASSSGSFIKDTLNKAFKPDKAQMFVEELRKNTPPKLESVELCDEKTLAAIIRNETPQTIALIFSHCDPKKSSQLLKLLPEAMHLEIIYRIAHLEAVHPDVIEDLDNHLKSEILKKGGLGRTDAGGLAKAAAILNAMGQAAEEKILETIETSNPELGKQIKDLLFVFNDLIRLNDAHIRLLIKTVPPETWRLALRAANATVCEIIYRNMSERAANLMKEDIASMPPMPLAEVEKARAKVIEAARNLEKQGLISLAKSDEVYV